MHNPLLPLRESSFATKKLTRPATVDLHPALVPVFLCCWNYFSPSDGGIRWHADAEARAATGSVADMTAGRSSRLLERLLVALKDSDVATFLH